MGLFLFWLFITITLFPTSVFSASGADVNSLMTKLFVTNNYNKNVRPLTDQSEIVAIRVEFYLNCEYFIRVSSLYLGTLTKKIGMIVSVSFSNFIL